MYRRLGRNGSDDRIDWRNGQTLSRDMRSRPRGRLRRTNENLGLNNKLGRLGRNWSDDRIGWCNGQTLSRDVILRPRGRLRRTEDNLGLDDKLRWTYEELGWLNAEAFGGSHGGWGNNWQNGGCLG